MGIERQKQGESQRKASPCDLGVIARQAFPSAVSRITAGFHSGDSHPHPHPQQFMPTSGPLADILGCSHS